MELPVKTVQLSVPSLGLLFEALPLSLQTPELHQKLEAAYRLELERMIAAAMNPECREPHVTLTLWRTAGEPPRQWIAEFAVSDLALPAGNAVNWHGQNTSQWCYAGAIVIQDNEVSLHH